MQLKINGKLHEVDAPSDTPLLWVLRDELGLTGNEVRLRDRTVRCLHGARRRRAVRSCVTPAAALEGADI